jgi:ADP-ribose pyrophosphatase YjhB (NUDIX family)
MLRVKEDLYNGLIIERDSIEDRAESFRDSLLLLLEQAKEDKKTLIWLELTTKQSQHIAIALEVGFEFHNCEAKRTTLTYQVKKDAYIPVAPSHTIGVGAVVINKKNELLMVRDRIHNNHSIYKLPGGMVEDADKLSDAVEREVWEETGIKAKLIKMVSLLNSHPYRFNKSNIYIVFQLEALTTEINVIDTHEIELALWMPLEEFFLHEEMSRFQKDLVKHALDCEGLKLLDNDDQYFNEKKHVEVYG